MSSTRHWFIGECMAELRRAGPGLLAQSFAGDVYNTAVYFERLVNEKSSSFVSAVGMDTLSQALLGEAAVQNLDTRHIARVQGRQPGLYWIELDAQGERSFLYWRAHSAARAMLDDAHFSMLQAQLPACALLYFSGLTLAILDDARRARLLQLARAAKEAGTWIAFDSNYRPSLWESAPHAVQWCDAAASLCTHALVTFDDEAQLHGDTGAEQTLERLLAAGVQEAVVKLGSEGCLVKTSAMPEPIAVPAPEVRPVDTTAAGDSFNAAYLAARVAGKPTDAAAREACKLAARVITYPGAIISKAEW
jgi:2-dehydro-3-deoxygluconokinase